MIRLNLYMCTFRRDEMLGAALDALADAAAQVPDVRLAVTVVDDYGEGATEQVLGALDLPIPVTYVRSASRNISTARNTGIAAALPDSDWIGMVDDDVLVDKNWLSVAREWLTDPDTDAVSGPVVDDLSHLSEWLDPSADAVTDWTGTDGCATANCLMRTDWLERHPDVRFAPALGVTGGEDMVFFGTAVQQGLRARHLPDMRVRNVIPPERTTVRYHLRRALWFGNSEAVTNLELDRATRGRLVLRGLRRTVRAAMMVRVRISGERPRVTISKYPLVLALQGAGMVAGAAGIRLDHH